MPIDLKKLARDVVHADVELQVLALQTLLRIDHEVVDCPADVLSSLRTDLTRLAAQGAGDSRFFARQCLDHIDRVRAQAKRELMAAPAAGPPEAPVTRLTQRLRSATPITLDAPSLARVAAEKRKDARPHVLGMLAADLDGETLASTLAALTVVGEPVDARLALPFLKHKDARVRANAVEVVEALAPKDKQVALLAGLSGDPENRVRANVLKALAGLGSDIVFAGLAGMLDASSIATRASAIYAMRHVRGDRVIELLWKASRDPSELIRLRVVHALEGNRHPQALEILRKLGNDIDISIAEAAYGALARLTISETTAPPPPPEGPVASLSAADEQVCLRALKEIDAKKLVDARDAVLTLIARNPEAVVMAQAVATLARIGQAADVPLAEKLLTHANDRVRANSAETLAVLAPPAVVVRALTPLLDDRDNRVRGNAVKALAEAGVTGLEAKVEPMLRHNEVPMRLSGAWCAAFLEPVAALRLLQRAGRDSEPDVRRKVVDSLGRLPPGPELAQLLRELSADPIVKTSEAARALLQKLGPSLVEPPPRTTLKLHMNFEEVDPATRPSARTLSMEMKDLGAEVARTPPPEAGKPKLTRPIPAPRALPSSATTEALYERLDAELEAMGRKLYALQEQNVISEPVFSKVNYQIKRYADLLRKRQDTATSGFLARLPFFRPAAPEKDPAELQLEFNLSEEYRRLGETAIELYHGVERAFPPVADCYERVENLLRQVKELKDRSVRDGE